MSFPPGNFIGFFNLKIAGGKMKLLLKKLNDATTAEKIAALTKLL